MEMIGLIAAMPLESKALLRYIKRWKRTAIGPFRGVQFRLMDRDCLLVTTGVGLAHAADGTRALLTEISPHLLVSFGIAGAVNNELHIGDVVVAENTCMLDMGLLGPSQPLGSLSKAAWQAAVQVLQKDNARLVVGTAITTRGSQIVPQPRKKMPYPILEMETAGIGQVATEMGIPLVSIRSISDGPQAPIPFDLDEVYDEKYNLRIGKLLMMVLRKPQLIVQSRQMIRNSQIAADHAARALVAALDQVRPFTSQ